MQKSIQTLIQTLSILFLVLVGCQKSISPEPTKLISHDSFESNLKIDGHEFDSLIIENCTFKTGGLSIGDADYVTIRNCVFEDIRYNGIAVGFTGPAKHITIENCVFKRIGYNAIDSHEDAPNGVIRNCSFEDAGLSETGAAMAQEHHAIYWKGENVMIAENEFITGSQPHGNCISVRSSGVIRKNVILNAQKNAIMYYSNHPGGDSLLIENNFIAYPNYGITVATIGNLDWHNENVIIRFNTILQENNRSIYIAGDFENTTNFSIYGNLLVNSTEAYFKTFYEVAGIEQNLLRKGNIDFVDPQNGDLHLLPGTEAEGFCAGLSQYPATDIDGDIRMSETLNAGADE